MLLIDGVKYAEWVPKNEEELELMVNEHAPEIFGENSMYFDRKLKLQSLSGIGSIPDGYAIVLGDKYEWHIVEVELSSHPLYNHVVPQISRFIAAMNNLSTQKTITEAIYHAIIADGPLYMRMDKVVQTGEFYKFVADLVSNTPVITIVIEKDTPELQEALSSLGHSKRNIVEFKTYTREGVGLAVHAHIFEPLTKGQKPVAEVENENEEPPERIKKVTASDFTYMSDGIFALASDSSVTIDVKKHIRLVGEQLKKHGLHSNNLGSFYWFLRKKVGLLNTPTED